jgi:hypothetical protein
LTTRSKILYEHPCSAEWRLNETESADALTTEPSENTSQERLEGTFFFDPETGHSRKVKEIKEFHGGRLDCIP